MLPSAVWSSCAFVSSKDREPYVQPPKPQAGRLQLSRNRLFPASHSVLRRASRRPWSLRICRRAHRLRCGKAHGIETSVTAMGANGTRKLGCSGGARQDRPGRASWGGGDRFRSWSTQMGRFSGETELRRAQRGLRPIVSVSLRQHYKTPFYMGFDALRMGLPLHISFRTRNARRPPMISGWHLQASGLFAKGCLRITRARLAGLKSRAVFAREFCWPRLARCLMCGHHTYLPIGR